MYRNANAVLLTDQRASFVKGDPLPEYIRNLELAEMPAGRVTELMAYPDGDHIHLRVLTDGHYSIEPVEMTCSGRFSILWERSYREDMEEDWEEDEDDWNDLETQLARMFPTIAAKFVEQSQFEQVYVALSNAERVDILDELSELYGDWLRPDISALRLLHFEDIVCLEADFVDPNGDPVSSSFDAIHLPKSATVQETAQRFVSVAPAVLAMDRLAAKYFTSTAMFEINDAIQHGRWPGYQVAPVAAEDNQA